jgi:serine/threonine protein kinase
MSTYTSEPGTRLAGRYRLVDQVNEGAGWTYWKATDETLARSVTVLTFAAGFPRVTEAVTAARSASRLNDPRFAQVFDVEDADDGAYVVLEWVAGESLLDMLSEGPLEPPAAASLMVEAAQAIAMAHDTGLAHLRLDPACLHWTARGGVKIAGLGIDAALAGPELAAADGDGDVEDPDLVDTRDLARLLYAALTGYWPGAQTRDGSAALHTPGLLPPAPEDDGAPCTPRQVSAGVPAGIDDVTCRALFQRSSRHGPALSTATAFAEALNSAAPPLPFPVPAPATSDDYPARQQGTGTNPYLKADADPRNWSTGDNRGPAGGRSGLRATISVAIVVVLVAIGVVAWSVSRSMHHTPTPAPSGSGSGSPSASAAALLAPAGATSYDALGSDGGNENANGAKYAIDGSTSTFWHTDYYLGESTFGNLKKGTGLILDMGKQVQLSQVTVQFGTICCTHVNIEIGNNNAPTPAALNTFTTVQSSNSAVGVTNFNVTKKATGRYVLIWITDLPPRAGSSNSYQALIYNVILHGSAASSSG